RAAREQRRETFAGGLPAPERLHLGFADRFDQRQDPRLLERLAARAGGEPAGVGFVLREARSARMDPTRGERSIAGIELAAGKDDRAAHEGAVGVATHAENLEAFLAVAQHEEG